ncbi:D5 family helicase-primase [Bodo saltans virus]|uniref:D5 family helicase-primase n=1 Tax=Bodo saltans virus TaxID=2024608 RepID=A0A2H4UWE2_9VIRU|nr:D5 family helicase-primase [Bodo saltans virus]ATZ81251.1 D5 family helicase-primase [Bodo saltans virus]
MKKKAIPKALRIAIWDKYFDEYIGKAKCKCCNLTDITQLKFECGHIIAESHGGNTDINNLIPICNDCNKSMGVKNFFDFKKSLVASVVPKNIIDVTPVFIIDALRKLAGDYFVYVGNELYCFNPRNKLWYSGSNIMKKYINDELYDYLFSFITDSITDETAYKFQIKELKNYCLKVKGQEILCKAYEIHNKDEVCKTIIFNENKFLFGFSNGVYDLKLRKFRKYEYDDYITLHSGYEYAEGNDDDKKELLCMIRKIMPEKDKFYLLMQILASGLIGKAYQNLFIFNGSGGNGKSSITKLMKLVLGNYYYKLDPKYLSETSRQGANPELANLSYKRYVNSSEPPESKKIKNSIYKQLTGDGEIEARKCNSNDTKVKINATLILECNKRPLLEEEPTKADTRRIIDLIFCSEFKTDDNDVDEHNHIYKANKKYEDEEQLSPFKCSFFEILADYAYTFLTEENECFAIPDSVKERSTEYLNSSCQYLQFLKELTHNTLDDSNFISIGDLLKKMKQSDLYINSTKEIKKKINLKSMVDFFSTNTQTSKKYKSLHRPYINGQQKCYSNVLVGYQFVNSDISDPFDDLIA